MLITFSQSKEGLFQMTFRCPFIPEKSFFHIRPDSYTGFVDFAYAAGYITRNFIHHIVGPFIELKCFFLVHGTALALIIHTGQIIQPGSAPQINGFPVPCKGFTEINR